MLTKEQIIRGLINPSSGDYVDLNTKEKVCVLWVGEEPHELGRYSLCLPEPIQRHASRNIWALVEKEINASA
jgi:hypothetical protein